MSDDFEVPERLVEVLAKQMYGRTLRRRAWDAGWDSLSKAQRTAWLEDARAVIGPMYREIADELERRMLTDEAIAAAVKAAKRGGLKDKERMEEAVQAAWGVALPSRPRRRTLAQAIKRFAQAVREFGGDIDATSMTIGPGEIALRTAGLAEDKARDLAVGAAIGLLMAGDSEAEAGLGDIYDDWTITQEAAAA